MINRKLTLPYTGFYFAALYVSPFVAVEREKKTYL
jgi:hypothetical protein